MKRHTNTTTPTLEFTAKNFHHHEKNSFWYIGMLLLLTACFAAAIYFGEYLLSVVVVAAGVAIFRLSNLQPDVHKIQLTAKGIYWGDRFYGYHQLRAFWIADQQDRVTLYLERLNLAPQISFVIPVAAEEKVVHFLSQFLPHHYHRNEPLSDRFGRLLKL